jgi:hypothetical protein
VEGGGGGLTVSGLSRNRVSFVKCVAIQKRLGIPTLGRQIQFHTDTKQRVESRDGKIDSELNVGQW